MTKSRTDARKYKRSVGVRAPKSAISRSMVRYSLRSLGQKELVPALDRVPHGGEGDHRAGGGPCLRRAELVLSQVRQAGGCGIPCGAPRAIECRPPFVGKKTSEVTPDVSHVKAPAGHRRECGSARARHPEARCQLRQQQRPRLDSD